MLERTRWSRRRTAGTALIVLIGGFLTSTATHPPATTLATASATATVVSQNAFPSATYATTATVPITHSQGDIFLIQLDADVRGYAPGNRAAYCLVLPGATTGQMVFDGPGQVTGTTTPL